MLLTIVVSLIWVVVHIAYRNFPHSLKRCVIISFISIVFLLHPKLTEQSVNLFR